MANENLDYYSLCESALMNKFRTLTTYFPTNSKIVQVTVDDAALNRGADYFAVFTPDAFPNTIVDARGADFSWQILVDVYVRFTTQAEAKGRLKRIRADIINMLYPSCLNSVNGVYRTVVSANAGVYQDAPEGPNFIWQTFNITVSQRVRYSVP
jgi:hypothetical protein